MKLTHARLLALFRLEDGCLYWHKNGKRAGGLEARGYRNIYIDGVQYREHRLVFFYVNRRWPALIDHEHGVEAGNGLDNIREATPLENGRNMRRSTRNKSGVVGVYWSAKAGKWVADIRVSGRVLYLGSFDDIKDAAAARAAANTQHGFHPNHGKREPRAK